MDAESPDPEAAAPELDLLPDPEFEPPDAVPLAAPVRAFPFRVLPRWRLRPRRRLRRCRFPLPVVVVVVAVLVISPTNSVVALGLSRAVGEPTVPTTALTSCSPGRNTTHPSANLPVSFSPSLFCSASTASVVAVCQLSSATTPYSP